MTGQWSLETLSEGRHGLAATTVGTKAMFAGGQGPPGNSDAVDIYDDSTGTWSTATLSAEWWLPTALVRESRPATSSGASQGRP